MKMSNHHAQKEENRSGTLFCAFGVNAALPLDAKVGGRERNRIKMAEAGKALKGGPTAEGANQSPPPRTPGRSPGFHFLLDIVRLLRLHRGEGGRRQRRCW